MGKWYLVRHAQTVWNLQGRVQGHSESSLAAEGIAQAQRVAQRLSNKALHAAYTSDLARTRETAEIVLLGRGVPIEATPELREMSYGKWEGMTHKEIKAAYPEEYAGYLQGDIAFVPSGGEGPLQLMSRLVPLVHRLSTSHAPNEDILIVSHGGTLKGLLMLLMGMPPELFWRFTVAHGSVSVLTTYPDTAVLDLWNDMSHLEDPITTEAQRRRGE